MGIGDGCLLRRKKKHLEDGGHAFPGHGRLRPEQEEMRRLERRLGVAERERDIFKKAVAILSQGKREVSVCRRVPG
ncbi:transposase [Chloroflexota bacterium]